MHRILSYIKFLLKSKNQHGVHSPFVYDLLTKCFYDKTNYLEYEALKAYRLELL
ncbi:MAG: class I SAM-dependent methyltransferase, partial [Gelidibacter sp.]